MIDEQHLVLKDTDALPGEASWNPIQLPYLSHFMPPRSQVVKNDLWGFDSCLWRRKSLNKKTTWSCGATDPTAFSRTIQARPFFCKYKGGSLDFPGNTPVTGCSRRSEKCDMNVRKPRLKKAGAKSKVLVLKCPLLTSNRCFLACSMLAGVYQTWSFARETSRATCWHGAFLMQSQPVQSITLMIMIMNNDNDTDNDADKDNDYKSNAHIVIIFVFC